ncbi:MAG: ABC transporter permease [Nanoarchaeota archaeon]
MKSFVKMFDANLKEFLRDRSGLFWTFAFPICFIFLFGLLFTGDGQGISFDYILPGILAMALMQLGLFGALQFLYLREKKIIRGLSVTPLSRSSLLSSEILLRLLAGFVQTGIIIFLGVIVFDITLVGNIIQILLMVLLGSLTFVSFGYMLICFVKSMEGGSSLAQIVQLPMMFLSGIFFPVEMMPGFMQPVVKLIPLTYLADSLRNVMIGVPGNYSLKVNILVLLLWLIFTFIITVKYWRWE